MPEDGGDSAYWGHLVCPSYEMMIESENAEGCEFSITQYDPAE